MTGLQRLLAPELVHALERFVDERVAQALAANHQGTNYVSPYLTVSEAAALMRCSRQRIDDLLSARRLSRVKEGRRTLLLRTEVEEHLRREPRRP